MKLSRRGIFSATAAALALSQSQAQDEAKPATAEEDLASARTAIKNNSAALAGVKIPIATEPSFVFKA